MFIWILDLGAYPRSVKVERRRHRAAQARFPSGIIFKGPGTRSELNKTKTNTNTNRRPSVIIFCNFNLRLSDVDGCEERTNMDGKKLICKSHFSLGHNERTNERTN